MTQRCPKTGCTIAATGICFLNYMPTATCPVLRGEVAPGDDEPTEGSAASATAAARASIAPDDREGVQSVPTVSVTDLAPPAPTKARLSPGRELGLDGLATLAAKRPVRLIGLLGSPAAGKTMALISMFLLAARGKLAGYQYRNSESAFAFDDLSRGVRAWSADGGMLDQLVPHTELADERRPGFLHLRLHASAINTTVDVAFPDLPGEWTETLVNKNTYERLSFLRNADAIWLFVDGEKLADLNTGHKICERTRRLIGRLAVNLPNRVPLKLVVTRADQYQALPPGVLEPIKEEAAERGYDLQVHEIMSVDQAAGTTRSGKGIPALLDDSITVATFGAAKERPLPPSPRWMLRYRSEQAA